jgi:hypothetical protein
VLAAATSALALVPSAAAAAVPTPVFSVRPATSAAPYVVLDTRPGATVTRAVRVTNTGTHTGSARLYAVDATTGRTTGAVYRSAIAPRRDVGAWTKLRASHLRLAPGQSRTVAFTVRVPRWARDGQHLGGIVAESTRILRGKEQRRGNGSFRIDTRHLAIMAVQVDLPGPRREQMLLTGVRPGRAGAVQTLEVSMRNAGNVLVRGRGTLSIRDAQGRSHALTRFNVDTFLPRTDVADPVALTSRALPEGRYRADLVLRYGHGKSTRLSTPFEISKRQVDAVFGAQAPRPPAAAATQGLPVLWLVLGMLVSGLCSALFVMRLRAPRR